MKQFTVKDIDALGTCYSASRYLPKGWSGTILDILDVTECPPADRLFVVRQSLQLSGKVLRLFAVECAKKALTYPENYTPDPRTLRAIEVAEEYAHGRATQKELDDASCHANWAAADAAVRAYDAANAAAYAATCSDFYAAACAGHAAADAAGHADAKKQARLWQVEKLKELIKEYM